MSLFPKKTGIRLEKHGLQVAWNAAKEVYLTRGTQIKHLVPHAKYIQD